VLAWLVLRAPRLLRALRVPMRVLKLLEVRARRVLTQAWQAGRAQPQLRLQLQSRLRAARSSGHLAACCGASKTGCGAAPTVFHLMCATLFCAPVANVGTQLTKLFGKGAVAGDGVSAQAAHRRTFNAT
jgi:hypothetical protein